MADDPADRLVGEFLQFVQEHVSHMDIVKQRVATVVRVLQHPDVAPFPLQTRVAFLRFKSFSSGEIECALEQTNEREYLRYLEALNSGALLEAVDDGGEPLAQTTTTTSGVDPSAAAGGADGGGEDAYWRAGALVYAFKGDGSYYPVPFVGIDPTRAEDILMIRHQLPSGEYGPVQYLTAGFKGVVPDEFAPYDLVNPGMTVIAEYPGAYRNHFKEAVVLGKSASQPDGSYTVDLEWVVDSERQPGTEFRSIRLLQHPKRLLAERQQAAFVRKQNQGSSHAYNSTTSFHPCPATQPPTALMVALGGTSGEIPEYIKNFIKVPHLDRGVQPRTLQTAAQFVAQYGQFYYNQGVKSFPLHPQSQADKTMNGFGFQLAHLERHPQDVRFFARNPLVDVCDECYRKDAMFVDPEFPPSFFSVTGMPEEVPEKVVWRRCSEIFSKPRLFTIGSKALDVRPGQFSPPWLIGLLHALQGVAEIEEMISPGSDGWTFGAYTVKVFLEGAWHFTIVDDFVPCDEATGEPLACTSGAHGEIYCMILEKVLAKIAGSYAQLRFSPWSTAAIAWEDLSSNTLEVVDHHLIHLKDSLSENLFALVTSGTNAKVMARVRGHETRFEDIGFQRGDCWMVDAITQFVPPTRKAPLYFFHVCRPTHVGHAVPYVESHKEKFYSQFPPGAVDHFPTRGVRDEGVAYWISSIDFYNIFDRTFMLWFYNNTQRVLLPTSFAGRPTCAPKMFGIDRWLTNPQVLLSFVQPTDVIIEVRLRDGRIPGRQPFDKNAVAVLQAHLIKGLPVERPLTEDADYVASSQAVDLRDDEEGRFHPSAVIRATLPGGNFVLVPSLSEGAQEDLLIKVFSVSAFYGKVLN